MSTSFSELKLGILFVILILTGVGAMMVGLLPETAGVTHTITSLITLLFGGVSAIVSYKLEKPPFSYLSVALGTMSLAAPALFGSGDYLNLGAGEMEHMIAYPALL